MNGQWSVVESAGCKMVHRSSCRYAKHDYAWANRQGATVEALVAALVESGGAPWHIGCRVCAPDLDAALAVADRSP